MARIPQREIEKLQREISVQRLAEVRGVKLKRSGREYLALCPFHKDTDPSLRINPAKISGTVWARATKAAARLNG